MATMRIHHIAPDGAFTPKGTLAEGLEAAAAGGYVWIDLLGPGREDLVPLVEALGIDPLTVEDCLDTTRDQLPKVEEFPRTTVVLTHAHRYIGDELAVSEIDAVVGEGFLVSVGRSWPDGVPVLGAVQAHAERERQKVRRGPAFLLQVILETGIDGTFAALGLLEDRLDVDEEQIFGDPGRFNPASLLRLRRELYALRRSLFYEREVLRRLSHEDYGFVPEAATAGFRDTYDHVTAGFEMTESARDLVTSLREMHLAMLNNRMAHAANQTNTTVRRLTFITTIFMPLTLIAGIGGMSEWTMMTGQGNWPIAYAAFLAAMAVIGYLNYRILRRIDRHQQRRGGRTWRD